MSLSLKTKEYIEVSIHDVIEAHPAWLGRVSGLKAEKMLRGRTPYTFVLRAGETESENERDYYVSFVQPDSSIKHQPFVITLSSEGWSYENYSPGGPYEELSIEMVLHLIMHCQKEECNALIVK